MRGHKRKVYVLSTMTNKVLKEYDSICECAREEVIDYRTVANHCYNGLCKGKNRFIRSRIYFSFSPEGINHQVLAVKDRYSGQYIGIYCNPQEIVANLTDVSYATIQRTLAGTTKPYKYEIERVDVN